jgi:hypothetical protein
METGKTWFVDIDGTIHQASTETIDQWIWDGTMLAQHRVSREGARWLEAGKAPQFADHFVTSQEMNQLLGSDGIALKITPRPEKERFDFPSEAANKPKPFGVKLLGGSAIALLIGLLGGYLWAYQFSAPKDLAVINISPEMQALQGRYDTEKAKIDEQKAAWVIKTAPTPVPAKLGPGTSRNIRNQTEKFQVGPGGGMSSEDLKRFQEAGGFGDKTPGYSPSPLRDPGVDAFMNGDQALQTLNLKFEAEKEQIISDSRAADSRSKFYPAFVLLFLGLAGFNLVRLSLSSKK